LFAVTLACGASVAEARAPRKRPAKKDAKIVGKVALAEDAKVVRVTAIDRDVKAPMKAKEMPVTEYVGRILGGGARFEIDVPSGTYDLHFELEEGLKIDGADLRVSAAEDAPPLRQRDRDAITKRILAMRLFENEKHVLAIDGAGERAKVLVKLVRTNPTSYDRKYGEPIAIFRWEVWNFRKRTGSWVRERKCQVLRRFLVPKKKMDELKWDFLPALGGVDVKPDATAKRDVDLRPPTSDDESKNEMSDTPKGE
jgi:hypothetical protein